MNLPLRSIALATLLAASACTPTPPPTEQPPVPKAERNTELRDAIQAPVDKARTVEDTQQQATDRQRAEIEAATQ